MWPPSGPSQVIEFQKQIVKCLVEILFVGMIVGLNSIVTARTLKLKYLIQTHLAPKEKPVKNKNLPPSSCSLVTENNEIKICLKIGKKFQRNLPQVSSLCVLPTAEFLYRPLSKLLS